MTTYTIETETNNITAHATKQEARAVPNSEYFGSAEQLAKLAANWPTARLVEIWNGMPGVTPVKKFTDRKAATTRIWKAVQSLGESIPTEGATEPACDTAPAEPKVAADQEQPASGIDDVEPETVENEVKGDLGAQSPDVASAEEQAATKATLQKEAPTSETVAKVPREASKTSQVIAMLKGEGGTTLEELMAAMGWQKHTTRAMLSAGGSLTKKHGLIVSSEKIGDKRIYSIKA